LNSGGTGGRFIEFDSSGVLGSGTFEAQDAAAFAASALKGPYVLSLSGKDSAGNRIGAVGVCYFDGAGSIVGGSMDVNDGGNILPTFSTVQGIYRIDPSGRGLVNLDILGFESGAFEFSVEVVSANKLMLVSIDPLSSSNPIFGGIAELQTGVPFLSSSFKGPTVFSLGGESGNVSQVIVGQITFDGIDQPLVEFDQNTGGKFTTGNVLTGAYSVGVNGAGTLNLDDSNGSSRTWTMYAVNPNHAFLLDDSTSMASTGEIKPQTTSVPFTTLDILGGYGIGSGEPLVYGAPLYSGVSNFDGTSAVSGTEDINVSSTLSANQSVKGTYTVSSSSNNGRGTLNLTSPSGSTVALWVISDSEVVGVELDAGNTRPIVLHFEQ
jgi:type II secretory pathway pseudopilin PulG